MGVNLHSTIIAKGENNVTLTNFTTGCVSKDVQLSLNFKVTSDKGYYESNETNESLALLSTEGEEVMPQNILRINDDNSTKLVDFNKLTLKKDHFLDRNEGNVTIDILYNIQKNFQDTINPIIVNFSTLDANATDAKAKIQGTESIPTGKGTIEEMRTFYFARIASSREQFPETSKTSIATPLYVEIFCKKPRDRAWCDSTMNLRTIGRVIHKTDGGWYLAKEHNGTLDGGITDILESNNTSIITSLNALPTFIDGRIDDVSTMYSADIKIEGKHSAEITIPSDTWLRFGTSSYRVIFREVSSTIGIGQDGYMLQRRPQIGRNGKMSW
jgi:hypothetical protein